MDWPFFTMYIYMNNRGYLMRNVRNLEIVRGNTVALFFGLYMKHSIHPWVQ
jgi:hypothetical protein